MATTRKLPSGKWQARVSYKDGDRYREKSFTAETKKDALRAAALFLPTKDTDTIGQMIDTYIDAKKAVLSPSTIKGYISMARTIKTRYASLCERTEVSQFDAQRIASHFSPKTARNVLGFLASAVKFSGGMFPSVTFPRWDLRSDFVPREEDVELIVKEVEGTKMELPVLLGMMGLRRSEAAAVTPEDLEGNVLHIHEAVVIGPDNRQIRKETKTRGSVRTIVVPDRIADLLRQGPVELSLNSIGKRFALITNKLGITMRFHDLRHYFVSYCHNILRIPDAQIMRLGGWSTDAVMKRHYRQSMHDEEISKQVASAFSGMISGTKKRKAL